jgi:hypothetical protein
MKKTGIKGCRKIAKDRETWNLIPKEARVLHGPYSQWKGGGEKRDTEREKDLLM